MILHDLEKTCTGPTQWEATNEHREKVYIHFHNYTLYVLCPVWSGERGPELGTLALQQEVKKDGPHDAMDEDEMLLLTGYTLAEGEQAQ